MTKRDRASEMVSSVRVGRCAMSMVLLQVLRRPPYDAVRGGGAAPADIGPTAGTLPLQDPTAGPVPGPAPSVRGVGRTGPSPVRAGGLPLLGVELDDQLLLHRRVDHLTGRGAVHEHA